MRSPLPGWNDARGVESVTGATTGFNEAPLPGRNERSATGRTTVDAPTPESGILRLVTTGELASSNRHDEALPRTHRRAFGADRPATLIAVADTQVPSIGAPQSDIVDRPDQPVLFFDPLHTEPLPHPWTDATGIDQSPSAVNGAQVTAVVRAQRDHGPMLDAAWKIHVDGECLLGEWP